MCGRFSVKARKLSAQIEDLLDCEFDPEENFDLCPTETVSTLIATPAGLQQLDTRWGIIPQWSDKLLINAKAETVLEKHTFRRSVAQRRCIVPCSGWFEWRSEHSRKKKYFFQREDELPALMAGFWYPADAEHPFPRLVTLTTAPVQDCQAYHHRMPLLIEPQNVAYWLQSDSQALQPVMSTAEQGISVTSADIAVARPAGNGQQSLF